MKGINMNEYLTNVYTSFLNGISNMDSLCEISSLHYMNGNIPDYSNVMVQQFYLLRYAYAYAFEYSLMYKMALKMLTDICDEVSIASIGCGALTDYAGLMMSNVSNKRVKYTGIDKVNWLNKVKVRACDRFNMQLGVNAVDYLKEEQALSEDIYMFPMSISELLEKEVECIANTFRKGYNCKDRFCVCVSIRKSDGQREKDIKKVQTIERGILDNGYRPAGNHSVYYIIPENKTIRDYQGDYAYPYDVLRGLDYAESVYKDKIGCRNKGVCSCSLSRCPILKTKEICYMILTFDRRYEI